MVQSTTIQRRLFNSGQICVGGYPSVSTYTGSHLKGYIRKNKEVLWQGNNDHRGTNWVSWKNLVVPKLLGGWGLKDIHLFGKSLVVKSPWNMITRESLSKKNFV